MPFRRNVFIVGAGFSAEAGAPVVSNFFSSAMELYKDPTSGLTPGQRAIFKEVFDYRTSLESAEFKLRIDPENIEELFGLVEMAAQLNNPEAQAVRLNLVYVILRTLELTAVDISPQDQRFYFKNGNNRHTGILRGSIYDLFVNVVARRWDPRLQDGIAQDVIISLNYDLLLEQAMQRDPAATARTGPGRQRLAPLYGLPEAMLEQDSGQQDAACKVRLFKLHGSANWAFCAQCKRVAILSSSAASVASPPPTCSVCRKEMKTRLIVPPAWNKEEYMPLLRDVWAGAAEALRFAQRIWIMGYSMQHTDKFFRYLLAIALQKNVCLDEVVIVNQDQDCCEKIANLFRALSEKGKVARQNQRISNYIMDTQTFQGQLKQVYQTQDFAW